MKSGTWLTLLGSPRLTSSITLVSSSACAGLTAGAAGGAGLATGGGAGGAAAGGLTGAAAAAGAEWERYYGRGSWGCGFCGFCGRRCGNAGVFRQQLFRLGRGDRGSTRRRRTWRGCRRRSRSRRRLRFSLRGLGRSCRWCRRWSSCW